MTVISLSVTVPGAARQPDPTAEMGNGGTPSSGARALALAHYIDDLLESGRAASASEVAAYLGVTRARMSQVLALLGLSARLQEQVLIGEPVMSGRELRGLLQGPLWARQAEFRADADGRR